MYKLLMLPSVEQSLNKTKNFCYHFFSTWGTSHSTFIVERLVFNALEHIKYRLQLVIPPPPPYLHILQSIIYTFCNQIMKTNNSKMKMKHSLINLATCISRFYFYGYISTVKIRY